MARKKKEIEAQVEVPQPEVGDGPDAQDINEYKGGTEPVDPDAEDASDGVEEEEEEEEEEEDLIPAAAPVAKPEAKVTVSPKEPRKLGGVAACAQVLANSGLAEMSHKDMVAKAISDGLWITNDKHPGVSAGINRDIRVNGEKALFRKVARGKYALNTQVTA